MPEDPVEQEHFKRRLMATASSLKKKQQQLQVDQDLLVDRWTEVLAAKEHELKRPSKSYPKRRLLPHLEEEAFKLHSPVYNAADRPLRGRAREAFQPKVQTAPRRHSVKNTARGNTEDPRDILDSKAKIARSIYGTRARAPTWDDDRRVRYTKSNSSRAEYSRQDSYELRRDIARHRGAAHPLCFTDEVMEHEFP